jgi:predicted transcriptional regulator
MARSSWKDVAKRCDELGISRAEVARRAGISESAFVKGIARDSRLSGATRKVIELVLALEEEVQRQENAA